MQIQQGDVLLQKVEGLPEDCKEIKRKDGYVILQEGELTGHAHRIADIDAMFLEKDGRFYLKNDKPIVVQHEEHRPITIPIGVWEIGRVREKDWLSGMVVPVAD